MKSRIRFLALAICLVMLFESAAVIRTTAADDTVRTLKSGAVTVTGVFPNNASLSVKKIHHPFHSLLDTIAAYDIKAMTGKDVLHPSGEVTVTVTKLKLPQNKDIQVIHVLDDASVIRAAAEAGTAFATDKAEIVDAFPGEAQTAYEATGAEGVVYIEYLSTADGTVNIVNNQTVSFKTSSFSAFIITDAVIGSSVSASEGGSYEIAVDFDVRAQIPADAVLQVGEISPDSEEYNSYLEQAAEKIGCTVEEMTYVRLFDMKLYGTESGEFYQPSAPVTVSVRLADREEIDAPVVRVVHFGESVEQLQSTVDGNVVTFTTSGFSVFVLAPGQHLHTYRFYVPTNEEQTQFEEYRI